MSSRFASALVDFRVWLACHDYGWLPPLAWCLFASPLLAFALGGPVFVWPRACPRSPFRAGFWRSVSWSRVVAARSDVNWERELFGDWTDED